MGSVERAARAIAAALPGRFSFLVEKCLLCHTVSGDYIRGICLERTSEPGRYRLWAFSQAWFNIRRPIGLGFSFDILQQTVSTGSAEQLPALLRRAIENDRGVRRVACANADDPIYFDTRLLRAGRPHEPLAGQIEYAAIRALAGDEAWARLAFQQFREELEGPQPTEDWQRRKELVIRLSECLETGGCVRAILDPIAAENRRSTRIVSLDQTGQATSKDR